MEEHGMGAAERALVGKLAAWSRIHPAGGGNYGSAWQLVLEEGRWWRPAPFPRELGRRRGRRVQDCYRQAARLAWAVEGLVYVEGFADPGIGAVMEHAWCADAAGAVVDPSWHDTTGDAYLGIPITLDYRARLLGSRPRRLCSDSVLDPRASPELLAEGLPPEAIAAMPARRC